MTLLRFTVPGTPRPKARHRYRIVKRKGAGMDVPNVPRDLETTAMNLADAWRMGLSAGRGSAAQLKDYFAMEYGDPASDREEQRIAAYCAKAMVEQEFYKVESGPIALFVLAVFKIPASVSKKEMATRFWHAQRLDLDNCAKLISDAMNGIAWGDDAQVGSVQAMKVWSLTEQFVEVVVVKLDDRDSIVSASWDEAKQLSAMMTDRAREVSLAGREQQVRMEVVG